MTEAPAAVVLLSGGLDSTTVLRIAAAEGRRIYALSFVYGQKHTSEVEFARHHAREAEVHSHEVVDLSALGRLTASKSSLLAASQREVPKHRDLEKEHDVPSTYVPARNALFLSYALAWAEVVAAREIWLGVNVYDYSGYPDCRPEFLAAFENMANLATQAGVDGRGIRLMAPLLELRKHEIILRGLELGVDYAKTLSCYDPVVEKGEALACGACDSCQLRRNGFAHAGVDDPTRYRSDNR